MDNLEPITRNEMFLNGDDLEPITREEMILAGADLEPLTRHEWFLKKYRGGGDVTIERLAVTENGTYSESGKAYSPVVVNVPTPPVPENAYLLNSLSGLPADIASFNDGTDLPMASLKVAVTPYQDLHGYDGPWAGGAGKNKLNNIASSKTENNVTFTVNSDGSVKVYSTGATETTVLVLTNTNNPLIIQANKSYILSGCPNGGSYSTYELMLIATPTSGSAIVHDYGSGVTIESSESDRILGVQIVIRSGQVINDTFYPMIRLSSVSDATFAPYSNICPISGWTEEAVTRCGKNLCKSTIHGYVSSTDNLIIIDNDTESAIFYAFEGKTYTISSSVTMNKSRLALVGTDIVADYTPILQREILADNVNTWTATWTGWTVWYKCGNRQAAFGTSAQVELGSTATTYESYNGHTYTIDLDGTRYGGTLDATNGTMDDTLDYIASYNGETLPSTWISDRDVYAEGTTPTIGAEVVYTRATPITVQLAPTPVKSLEGENNISANCGQITEGKYFKRA